jgi:hypothetical protein
MALMILALPMIGTEGLAKDEGYLRFGGFHYSNRLCPNPLAQT